MDLIGNLLNVLNSDGIQYVHWKSNTNIDRALSGEDDFDVLVSPADRSKVENIFADLKIIKVNSIKDTWQDDIYHYIGIDHQNLKLAHVHIHYGLPVGYDFDKNFKLPIVGSYLAEPVLYKNVYIPQVEKEYIILVIRLLLKNALTPFLLNLPNRQIQLILNAKNKGVVQGGGYEEFLDLKSRSDHQYVAELLNNEFKFISLSVFRECENTLDNNDSLLEFFRSGKKLKKNLNEYRNNSELKSFLLSFRRINAGRINKVLKKLTGVDKAKKNPSCGGRIIAFVGGDGAGKTTNISTLSHKLSRHLWVKTIHIGRPNKSLLGFLVKIFSKLALLLGTQSHSKALFYLSWALDRRAAFKVACKVRRQGGLVILDRIPLPGITSMDCPRIHQLKQFSYKNLIRWEEKIYSEIKGVDLLFVLKLNPEIALLRRSEDDPDELRVRSSQIWNNDWHAPYAIEINTGEKSPEEVEKVVLQSLGNSLSMKPVCTEILGLSGAGKTTLLNVIRERVPNVSTSFPFKKYKLLTLLGVIKGLSVSLTVYLKSKNFQVFKNSCQLFASLEILKHWDQRGVDLSTNYILDQGPLFQLALILKEGGVSTQNGLMIKKRIQTLFSKSYFLKVDKETLWHRVNQRKNHTCRAQRCETKSEFISFIDSYEMAFNDLFSNDIQIVTVDAVTTSLDELIHQILMPEYYEK